MDDAGVKNISSLPSFKWVFVKIKNPICGVHLWNLASSLTILTVGLFSKLLVTVFNTTKCYNKANMDLIGLNRPEGVPLVTVSNHHSVFDDPGIWGTLDYGLFFSREKMRWSLAAHDICFTNSFHSYFFMLGRSVPVVRGRGVRQEAVDFCLERMKLGDWIHVFPEGRVNMDKEEIRYKWGVGRLIYESPVTPIVLPIWHLGMDDIVPNKPPYVCRFGKRMTINFGSPIDFTELLAELRVGNVGEETARKIITAKIQKELMILKTETEKLHKNNL